jgi:hypothetical protein
MPVARRTGVVYKNETCPREVYSVLVWWDGINYKPWLERAADLDAIEAGWENTEHPPPMLASGQNSGSPFFWIISVSCLIRTFGNLKCCGILITSYGFFLFLLSSMLD